MPRSMRGCRGSTRGREARALTAGPDRGTVAGPAGGAGSAADYDHWFEHRWGRYAFAVESNAVVHAAASTHPARALDAGCGTGRFGDVLAGACSVGMDPDPEMLALACPRLAGRCVQGVVEHLPFRDETFDLTLAITVLEFVADPEVAVAELARVTRPGGRIILGALNPHSPWGLANRRRLRSGPWRRARFLDRQGLRTLGARHGETSLHGRLYAPGAFPGIALAGPALEAIGRVAPAWGAFQTLTIDKPTGP